MILLVVCYRLDNTSLDVTWTISPIVLWAGTEINLGVVSACLPSLRPIFTLITKGSVRPSQTKSLPQFNDSSTLRRKTTGTFGSRSRAVKPFSGIEAEKQYHPFSIIHDDKKKILDKGYNAEDQVNSDPNLELEELQPPQDKVMVREDICVNYSNV